MSRAKISFTALIQERKQHRKDLHALREGINMARDLREAQKLHARYAAIARISNKVQDWDRENYWRAEVLQREKEFDKYAEMIVKQ